MSAATHITVATKQTTVCTLYRSKFTAALQYHSFLVFLLTTHISCHKKSNVKSLKLVCKHPVNYLYCHIVDITSSSVGLFLKCTVVWNSSWYPGVTAKFWPTFSHVTWRYWPVTDIVDNYVVMVWGINVPGFVISIAGWKRCCLLSLISMVTVSSV